MGRKRAKSTSKGKPSRKNSSTKQDLKQEAKKPIENKKPPSSYHSRALSYFESSFFSRKRVILILGIMTGIMLAAPPVHEISNETFKDIYKDLVESSKTMQHYFKTEEFQKKIAASLDFRPELPSFEKKFDTYQQFNFTGKHPVIMIPGFTSTGLEIWDGKDCSKQYFRQRIWGTTRMFQQFMMNQKCWLEHLMLNHTTGLDPIGIKLRAALGLEAADYVVGGYWVWGKVIENLANIGYDTNNLYMASFDWRLSPKLLQERDFYYTKLKAMIEVAYDVNNHTKVVIFTHSYGTQVLLYFLQWVKSPSGGNGGSSWVNKYVDTVANIAGPTLGAPKTVSTLISGEMKDTAELGALSSILEYFFTPKARANLARSWSSVASMLPIGGNKFWGNASGAPDDFVSRMAPGSEGANQKSSTLQSGTHGSNGKMLHLTHDNTNVTTDGLASFMKGVNATYLKENEWMNPLTNALPNAPDFKILCLYGVGIPTERGYVYKNTSSSSSSIVSAGENLPFTLDTEYNRLPWIRAGVRYVEGDGTVPLLSLGYMCAKGWKSSKTNPGNSKVMIREHLHSPVSLLSDPRGGPETSDHVDIMGNHDMIKSLMYVAAGKFDELSEHVVSDIYKLVDNINIEDEDTSSWLF